MFYADADVKQIDVPSTTGSFGILAQHVPLLAALQPGLVSVHEHDGTTNQYFGKLFLDGTFMCHTLGLINS